MENIEDIYIKEEALSSDETLSSSEIDTTAMDDTKDICIKEEDLSVNEPSSSTEFAAKKKTKRKRMSSPESEGTEESSLPQIRKTRRRPNFTDEELMAMIQAVTDRKNVILGKLDNTISARRKCKAWEVVASLVNNVSIIIRMANEVRKKFSDLRAAVKKKVAKDIKYSSGTGGEAARSMRYSEVEKAMLPLIGTTAAHGLKARFDTEDQRPSGEAARPMRYSEVEKAMLPLIGTTAARGLKARFDTEDKRPSRPQPESGERVAAWEVVSVVTDTEGTAAAQDLEGGSVTVGTIEEIVEDSSQRVSSPVAASSAARGRRRKRRKIDLCALKNNFCLNKMLAVQCEMRDSLKELVTVQRELVTVQRELVTSFQRYAVNK